jgi:hypothetical protein
MEKISAFILGILVLLSCFASAQEGSLPPDTSALSQSQAPEPGQKTETSGGQQPMTDIHDIKPLVPVPVPVSLAVFALWTGVCIAAGALLLCGWFLWKRRRGGTVEVVEAVLSPEETAFQRLTALSADTTDGKAFYFKISFIFREYLQGRFGIDGLEMTTEELLPHVERLKLDRDLKRDSKKFIVSCDPVKFADAITFPEAMEGDFAFVKSFVEKTTPAVGDTANPAVEQPVSLEQIHRVSI